MAEIGNSVNLITAVTNWISDVILWIVGLFSGGILSIGSISIILLLLLMVTIWFYTNKDKLAEKGFFS